MVVVIVFFKKKRKNKENFFRSCKPSHNNFPLNNELTMSMSLLTVYSS